MPEGALITIRLQIKGKNELQRLNSEIAQLNKYLKKGEVLTKIADRQQQVYSKRLQLSNKILKEKINGDQQHFKDIARELNIQQDLNDIYESKIEIERRVLRAKEEATQKGIAFNEASARATIEAQVKEEMAYKRVQASINAKRKSLMQASISLFVMNISLNQLVSSLKPLVKGSEDLTKAIEDYQAMLNLTLGPMQAYMAFQQISINLSKQQAMAVKGMLSSMTVLYLMYKAITVQSKALKVAFLSLAGILLLLTFRHTMASIATMGEAISIATLKSILGGDMSGWMKVALGLGLMGLAAGVIGALVGFETPIGGAKRVGRTGLAVVHEGEVFGRPSMSMTNNNSTNINLYFGPGTSRDDADYISQAVQKAVARGRGSMTSGGISLG